MTGYNNANPTTWTRDWFSRIILNQQPNVCIFWVPWYKVKRMCVCVFLHFFSSISLPECECVFENRECPRKNDGFNDRKITKSQSSPVFSVSLPEIIHRCNAELFFNWYCDSTKDEDIVYCEKNCDIILLLYIVKCNSNV